MFSYCQFQFSDKMGYLLFCPENGFQMKVSHFQFFIRNPHFLLSATLSSPISEPFNMQPTSHSELGPARRPATRVVTLSSSADQERWEFFSFLGAIHVTTCWFVTSYIEIWRILDILLLPPYPCRCDTACHLQDIFFLIFGNSLAFWK